jgi:N4-gp56 family major capsid protein
VPDRHGRGLTLMATSLGTYIPSLGFLDRVVQDNSLVREFLDALVPKNLYREDAVGMEWKTAVGDGQTFTRASQLAPTTTPLTPGQDPTPKSPRFEQWSVIARQYGDAINTHMPSDWAAISSLVMRNAQTMGLQAAQSMNRVCRNAIFKAYLSGETVATALGSASTSLPVETINGFQRAMRDGRLEAVSANNPLTIQIAGVSGTSQVIGVSATDPARPNGPGTLTLQAAATWAANARVRSSQAPIINRAGGVSSVDALTTASALTLRDIRRTLAELKRNGVPPHDDGNYHVHLDTVAEAQLFSDNEFQRIVQGVPDNTPYRQFAVGKILGCMFISNTESPSVYTCDEGQVPGAGSRSAATFADEILAETRNANGVAIARTLITGKGFLMEAWIDEKSAFMTSAGVTGKVGAFSITNNGVAVEVSRVRYIIRAPIDVLQQVVTQAWSFSGDWGIPSDLFGGVTDALFKRAAIIESGTED